MPRCSGARTGQKLKKRKLTAPTTEVSASESPVLAALEAAVASAQVAAQVAAGDDGAVRTWLDDLLEQVEKQVADDEDRAELERDRHDRFVSVGVACVESIKRRTFKQYPTPSERSILRPFLNALQVNREEWWLEYPADKCDKCLKHIAYCQCRAPCSKCGQNVPRRAWQVCSIYPMNDMCRCEKISNFAARMCG